jgi:hypothetical protein
VWIAEPRTDPIVKRGELLAIVTDLLGRRTGQVRSPVGGRLMYIRGVPSMWARAALALVLEFLSDSPLLR